MDQGHCSGRDAGAADASGERSTHPRWSIPGVTIGDLTAWARTRFPGTIFDLRGGAPSVIGPTLEQLDRLARLYPEVSIRIGRFRLADLPTGGRGDDDVFGRSEGALPSRPSTLTLNRAYFSRRPRLARRLVAMVRGGWHPSGTWQVESVVTHEFGHHVWFLLEEEGFDPRGFMTGLTVDRRSLSVYAERDRIAEAWAETFVAHHLGDEDARNHPLTRNVVQFIERSLRERRSTP